MLIVHPRCRHPSALRRAIAALSFLGARVAARLNSFGVLIQKVANAIRFEHFWSQKVRRDRNVIILPSFTKSRSKHAIWNIALARINAMGPSGQILEFGTNNGGSLLYFCRHVPQAMQLHGFDSFEGIPEPWDSLARGAIKGYGAPVELWADDPQTREHVIEEARTRGTFPLPPQKNITIHKGLFAHTVPGYLSSGIPDDIRLIHFDADIYMGTRPVLDSICGQIGYRYYLLFDELYSVNHEFRAWMEFVEFFNVRNWRVLAISEDGVQALIEVS